MIQGIIEYIVLIFTAIGYALRLDERVYAAAVVHPKGVEIIVGIVFLAGVSMFLGQSVILFVNRVRRGRFVFSLLTNGVVFVVSYLIWGLAIAFIGWLMFDVDAKDLVIVAALVGLSTAPLVFGFLILIPYSGPAIGKLLNVWQLLIMITVVESTFRVGIFAAIACVGLSWLLMLILTNTIGRPVVRLRNALYRKVTGSDLESTTQDILLEFSGGQGLADQAPEGGQA